MLATFISPSLCKVLIIIFIDYTATIVVSVKMALQFFHLPKIKVAIPDMVFTLNVYEKKLVNRINAYGTIKKLDIYIQQVNEFLII